MEASVVRDVHLQTSEHSQISGKKLKTNKPTQTNRNLPKELRGLTKLFIKINLQMEVSKRRVENKTPLCPPPPQTACIAGPIPFQHICYL